MKKILSCVMALSIAACTVLSASAAASPTEVTSAGNATQEITYNNGEAAYTVTIPADVALANISASQSAGEINAEVTALNHGATLKVTVTSAHSFNLYCKAESDQHKIGYKLKADNEEIAQGGEVISTTETLSAPKALTIDEFNPDDTLCAGDYSDTLTFAVSADAQ